MRKLAIKTGWIILWVAMVITFFIAEEYLNKPPVETGNHASIENMLYKNLMRHLTKA